MHLFDAFSCPITSYSSVKELSIGNNFFLEIIEEIKYYG